ncbi:hypothetical protein CDIK_4104 [Cucumispora dikerogammari]|nr:hypothetical protein CDIK_4104 [Cucumispora dikerogammari]
MANTRKPRTTITDSLLNIIRNQINREIKSSSIAENNNLFPSCIVNIQTKVTRGLSNAEIICQKSRRSTINNSLNNTIVNLVTQDNAINQSGISESLRLLEKNLSQSAESRKLKALQITRKRLTLVLVERNLARVIELRFNYGENWRYIEQTSVFLDKTGFKLHVSSNMGYSFVNTKAVRATPANKDVNISLMCAISLHGIVGYQIQDGVYNGDLFISYLNPRIVSYFIVISSSVLIMDNCRFYHRLDVKRFLI